MFKICFISLAISHVIRVNRKLLPIDTTYLNRDRVRTEAVRNRRKNLLNNLNLEYFLFVSLTRNYFFVLKTTQIKYTVAI